jgi:hypothetical protein
MSSMTVHDWAKREIKERMSVQEIVFDCERVASMKKPARKEVKGRTRSRN